jgi:hypothetical protein
VLTIHVLRTAVGTARVDDTHPNMRGTGSTECGYVKQSELVGEVSAYLCG